MVSGTGLLDVTIEGGTVTLHGRPTLVGTAMEMADLVSALVGTVLSGLEREGVETRVIAGRSAEHLELREIDPIATHDTVMD